MNSKISLWAGPQIKWLSGPEKGYIDCFEIDEFVGDCKKKKLLHKVMGPNNDNGKAKCLLTVSGKEAHLDYEPFEEYNNEQGMCIGEMIIIFSDKERTKAKEIQWREKSSNEPELADAEFTFPDPEAAPPYVPPKLAEATKKEVESW